jgi:pyridoxamine 5'-phosphate oxidase
MIDDPIALFRTWFDTASAAGIAKPNAMTLASVDADGRPSARVVLLSSYDERGFVFHTNYESRKGEDIARQPRVALLFWWDPLGYQVRVEGAVEMTSGEESDRYFSGRPRGSQIGAWASEQSRVIESRAGLEERVRELEQRYAGRPVPRPPHWGGYRVIPEVFEFWEDRENRLHERVRYERSSQGGWRSVQLAP